MDHLSRLKLPVPPQHLAAFVPNMLAKRRESRSALEKITGRHPTGTVAVFSCCRLARSQFIQIKRIGGCERQRKQTRRNEALRHSRSLFWSEPPTANSRSAAPHTAANFGKNAKWQRVERHRIGFCSRGPKEKPHSRASGMGQCDPMRNRTTSQRRLAALVSTPRKMKTPPACGRGFIRLTQFKPLGP